jgi:hypothetical protein
MAEGGCVRGGECSGVCGRMMPAVRFGPFLIGGALEHAPDTSGLLRSEGNLSVSCGH